MKINLKIPVIIIALFLSTKVISQQDAQYTNYMYNTQMVQPAYVGSRGFTSIATWPGHNGLTWRGSRNYHHLIWYSNGKNDNMGIGLSLFTDKIGPTAENRITIDYAFAINFIWSKLTFGLKAGINEFEIDYTRLNIADDNDPLVQYNANKIQPRFGLGICFNTEEYYLGISAPNILETNYYDELNIENTSFSNVSDRIHFYGMAGYVFDLTPKIKVKPATLVKIVKGAPLQWDLSMNFLINYKVTLGIANRLDSALSFLGGFQLSDTFFIGLGYDYMTNQLRRFNDGSYEVVLRLDLFGRDRKIITPRFF